MLNASPRGLMGRIDRLLTNPHFKNHELNQVLNFMMAQLSFGGLSGQIQFETLVLGLEHVSEKITGLEEVTQNLQSQINDLKDQLRTLQLQAIFGDLTKRILENVISAFEAAADENNFDMLQLSLGKEWRTFHKNEHTNIELLYVMPNHSKLKPYILSEGWTLENYQRIVQFSKNRNIAFHSNYERVEDKTLYLNQRLMDLDDPLLPPDVQEFREVLVLTVQRLLAVN